MDLVRYYLAVAEGALRGAGGRPMALKRFVNGAAGDFFFQKRAPENRPDWLETVELSLPVRAHGGRGRPAQRGRPGLGRRTSATSTSIPTRCAPRTSTIPTSCASTSTPCRACRGRRSATSRWSPGRRSAGRRARRLAQDVRLAGHPHQRPHRAALDVPGGPPGGARDRAGRRAAGARPSPPASGGRRSATASSSTTTRTPRTGRSRRRIRSARRRTRASRCRCAGTEVPTAEMEAFTLATVPGALRGARRSARRASTKRSGSLEALLELSARDEAEGLGDAPWPPQLPQAGGRAAARPALEAAPADSRLRRRPRQRPSARSPARRWSGASPEAAEERASVHGHPTDADRPATLSIPVIEISRAATEGGGAGGARALEGAPPRRRGRPRAGRRPGGLDARPLHDVVPASASTSARSRRGAAAAGGRSTPTTTRGANTVARPERPAGARPEEEAGRPGHARTRRRRLTEPARRPTRQRFSRKASANTAAVYR